MLTTLLQAVALLAALVALARWATAPRPSHADAEAALLRGGLGQAVLRSPTLVRVAGPLAARVAAAVEHAAARLAPPAATLLLRINGGLALAIAAAAVDLGLADAVAGAPHPPTAADLAAALAVTDAAAADRVHRFLRAAAAVGLFEPVPPPSRRTPDTPHTTRWRNTRASAALRSHHAQRGHTQMPAMIALAGLLAREAWPHLADAVRAPGGGFAAAHGGTSFFPWLAANPRSETIFHAAMVETGWLNAAIVAATLKGIARAGPLFRPPRRVVDVGGGTGSFLRALLRATPATTTTGILFDLPRIAHAAPKSARIDVVGGSFFRAADLPPLAAGDAVTLRCVLHDWSDDAAAAILRALRAVVGRGVRAGVAPDPAPVVVAIIDAAVPLRACADPWKTGVMDANMMATVGGRERSVPEVARLLRDAGWAPIADVKAAGPMSVVVGVAV